MSEIQADTPACPWQSRQVGSDLSEEVLSFPSATQGTHRQLCPGVRGLAGRWALVRGFLCGPQGLGLPHWAVPQSRGPPLEQGTALRVTWLENRPDKWGHCPRKREPC